MGDGEGLCIFLVRDSGYKGELVMIANEEGFYDRKDRGREQVKNLLYAQSRGFEFGM